MIARALRPLVLGLSLTAAACGGASRPPLTSIAAVDRVKGSPAAAEAERYAPQMVALARGERQKADEALEAGDAVSADLYAERSLAAYEHAIVLARLARAAEVERDARARLERSAGEARELAATRARLDSENNELDKQMKVARELAQMPVSGPADPKREAARKVAAESLLAQARLLCGAGRLVAKGRSAPELDEAEKTLAAKMPDAGGAAVDAAARARAACLGALTKLRREPATAAVHADALLSELTATGHFDAARDERGVVVTLREVFDGAKLKTAAEKTVAELGRVLKQNAAYRAQVVVHEAARRDDGDARADAVASALAQAAGVAKSDVGTASPGARLPVVDPSDAKLRARNARVDVVFVSPTN